MYKALKWVDGKAILWYNLIIKFKGLSFLEELLKQILEKVNSMDDKIVSMDNKISSMDDKINSMDDRISSMDNKISLRFDSLETKLKAIHDQTADLTEFRTETKDSLDNISKDVKFIKHKLHETEEDVFDIKDHLKIVR